MMNIIHNLGKGIKYDIKLVERGIRQIFTDYNLVLESLVINQISDEELRMVNIDFLDHDYYTDIITFNTGNDFCVEGEIFLSFERVKENGEIFESTHEIYRVVFHGCLHLCGFNDQTDSDKRQMRDLENKYLEVIVPRGTKN